MSSSYVSRYSRVDQVKFFKGCLPQIFLDPLLNTLTHIRISQLIGYTSHLVGFNGLSLGFVYLIAKLLKRNSFSQFELLFYNGLPNPF